ncbi:MAG: FecR family protein [Woeseiaceae bacterium]|nr:FecR family protein [Woeseiaceae bacterium]
MDDVGKLIRYVGPRAGVDADRFERARARVEAHWESVVTRQQQTAPSGYRPPLALAAALVLTVAAGLFAWRFTLYSPSADALTVNRVVGEVRVDGDLIASGDSVPVDGVITTSDDGRIALQLADGQSLRIDHGTQLIVSADNRFRLDGGAVYVDSGRDANAAPVFIETRYGVATDVGTQFQVRLLADTVIVGVREGLVALARQGHEALTVDRGYLLEVTDDGGADRRRIDDDSLWGWVNEIAPQIDTNGMTLAGYLDWYSREKGYEIEWADAESRDNARQIRLSVSIQGLALDDGLAVVQAVAPFDYDIDDATMRIAVER